jgi:hypothetical protein
MREAASPPSPMLVTLLEPDFALLTNASAVPYIVTLLCAHATPQTARPAAAKIVFLIRFVS